MPTFADVQFPLAGAPGPGPFVEEGVLADGWTYHIVELYSALGAASLFQPLIRGPAADPPRPTGDPPHGYTVPLAFPTRAEARAAAMGFFAALQRRAGYPDIGAMERLNAAPRP